MTRCDTCLHRNVCDNVLESDALDCCGEYKNESEWVHLPCKVGDTVYYPVRFSKVISEKVVGILIGKHGTYVLDECRDPYEIGVDVFTTKEEADAVYKKMEKQND